MDASLWIGRLWHWPFALLLTTNCQGPSAFEEKSGSGSPILAEGDQNTSQDGESGSDAPLDQGLSDGILPDGPTFGSDLGSIDLDGDGRPDAEETYYWIGLEVIQPPSGLVDILWVIDTSQSMTEEQEYLATNFTSFIEALQASGTSFQTSVTTTDICQDSLPADLTERRCPIDAGGTIQTHLRGQFVGDVGRRVLKDDDSDLVPRFADYTRLGANGSSFEHGLKAADLALQRVGTGENEALLRSEAFLAVIVLSDEEDDGIGLSRPDGFSGLNFWARGETRFKFTEDDFLARLAQVKPSKRFSISAITPTRNTSGALCSAPHTQPFEEGTQYIAAARKTGGIVQSICETRWDNALATIGRDLTSQVSQVALSGVVYAPSIRVAVNSVITTHWQYVSGTNSVKFNADMLPKSGDVIRVEYVRAAGK